MSKNTEHDHVKDDSFESFGDAKSVSSADFANNGDKRIIMLFNLF